MNPKENGRLVSDALYEMYEGDPRRVACLTPVELAEAQRVATEELMVPVDLSSDTNEDTE